MNTTPIDFDKIYPQLGIPPPNAIEKLYLQYRGIRNVENLSEYTNLKVLHLEGNSLIDVSSLSTIDTLERLYLHRNQIESLSDFPSLSKLETLDMSNNRIMGFNALPLPSLSSFLLRSNRLSSTSTLSIPLSVTILDLSDNNFTDLDSLLEILSKLTKLSVLFLQDNPITDNKNYRKIVTSAIPSLVILDGKSVSDDLDPTSRPISVGSPQVSKVTRSFKLKYETPIIPIRESGPGSPLKTYHLPNEIDLILTDKRFSPESWPVWDQGGLGSCTAFAILSTLHYYLPNFNPSPLFQYYNERMCDGTIASDEGSTMSQAANCFTKYGFCSEANWPYDPTKYAYSPPKLCYDEASNNKTMNNLTFQPLEARIDTIMETLASGCPIILGISVYSSFQSPIVARTGIVPMPGTGDSLLGGHAVSLVGYNMNTKLWKLRNSWGPDWGDQGYFYLPFDYITKDRLASDLWKVNPSIITGNASPLSSLGRVVSPTARSRLMSGEGIEGLPYTSNNENNNGGQTELNSIITRLLAMLPDSEKIFNSVASVLTFVDKVINEILSLRGQLTTSLGLKNRNILTVDIGPSVITILQQNNLITGDLGSTSLNVIYSLKKKKSFIGCLPWSSK